MARLYANENFPLPVVEELRRLGHDAVTVAKTTAGKVYAILGGNSLVYGKLIR